jgi:NADH dehydrogenase [ubiquinone] 1 alpha subcomplex assembly factor 7
VAGAARKAGAGAGVSELGALLARRIRAMGPLSLAEYMSESLLHPRLGYYATRDPLGARGDFITAPEVSQIFGELVGLWCADTWEKMGRPPSVIVAELGPGRGTLLADALRAWRGAPDFRRALSLHLVERSPVLRAAQRAALADAATHWHDDIAGLPDGPLIVVANEFLDALPIRQLVRGATGWHERRVALAGDGASLAFALDPGPSIDAAALVPAALADAPPGSPFETRPAALALGAALGARLAAQGGAALVVDYGHCPSACGDTLQALRRHRRHDVLADPGEADLTAHVDFAAFAEAAIAAGARAWGPVPQGAFLASLGMAERAARLLARAKPAQIAPIESGCRRLLDPGNMGTLFKALALADPGLPAPAGLAQEYVP